METIYSNEAIIIEKNEKKYALLPLCLFHDIETIDRNTTLMNQFGLKDMTCSKSLYEIVDEKKLILANIKYGI
jgi:hypothetical protein